MVWKKFAALIGRVTLQRGRSTSSCYVLTIDQSSFNDADKNKLRAKLPAKAACEAIADDLNAVMAAWSAELVRSCFGILLCSFRSESSSCKSLPEPNVPGYTLVEPIWRGKPSTERNIEPSEMAISKISGSYSVETKSGFSNSIWN